MKKLLIISAVLSLLLLGSCAGEQGDNPDYAKMTEIGNARNFGIAIEDGAGGVLFRTFDSDGLGIKREIGGETTLIASGGIGEVFLCHDNWVYYSDAAGGAFSRINIETKESQKILDEWCCEVVVLDHTLYCTLLPDCTLCAIPIASDGSLGNAVIYEEENVKYLTVYDGELYYVQESTLYKGVENKEVVLPAFRSHDFYILDDKIYFINIPDGFLCETDFSGNTRTVANRLRPLFMNVRYGKLLFVAIGERAIVRTYQYDPKEETLTQFSPYGYGEICVANGKVYEMHRSDSLGANIRCLSP